MAYDEHLAARVRAVIPDSTLVHEREMFGGIAFLVGGHMACGVMGDRLLVRVASDAYDAALAQPHARPMELGGRRMRAFVSLERAGLADESALDRWVRQGISFVSSLPPK
jgi:TfoX/Sxy family transcriptional regulator of competence genes